MGSVGCWAPRSWSATRAIRRPKGWWSGPTGIWRPRSCPAGPSARRRTSTLSWATGAPLVNQRRRRVLGCAPADRIDADRAAMLPLPPVAPQTGWQASLRLPRDHYVRLDSNDYSVHPAAVGRRVEVDADLERVWVWSDGRLVAAHTRCWARHQTLNDPVHLRAAAQLRHQRAVLARHPSNAEEVQLRCLADYDAAV